MANDKDIKIGIKTTADTSGAEDARDSLSGVDKAAQEAAAAYVKKADAASAAMEEEARAAEKLNQHLEEIKALQQAQILGEFAQGLGRMSRAARDNGLDELAEDLDSASTGMTTAATIIQGGLGLKQLIVQLGGVRAALGATMAFLTGPVGIALIAAAGAFLALKAAVKSASDEMDRIAKKAAEPALFGEKGARASEQAVKDTIKAIDKEIEKLDELIEKRKEEMDIIRRKSREAVAGVDAEAGVKLAKLDAERKEGLVSEEDYIKRRAKIEQDAATKKFEIGKKEREQTKENATATAQDAVNAAQAARDELDALEKKAKARPELTREEKERLRALNDQAAKVSEELAQMGGLYNFTPTGKRKKAAKQQELDDLNEEREKITSKASDRVGKVQIQDQKQIADQKKRIAELEKQAADAIRAARKTRADVDSQGRIAATRFTQDSATRAIGTTSGVNVARAKKEAADKAKAAREAAQAEQARKERDRQASAAAGKAAGLAKGAPAELREAVETAKANLQDGIDPGELKALSQAIKDLFGALGDKQSSIGIELKQVSETVKTLKRQVENQRPTGS